MKVYKIGKAPVDAVYIGRGSPWGNPFKIGTHGDRGEVIAKYLVYMLGKLEQEPQFLEPLKDKDLWCYCKPLACHGDVIVKYLEKQV